MMMVSWMHQQQPRGAHKVHATDHTGAILVHSGRCRVQCRAGKSYIDPVETSVSAFGPATIANLGPGFDWLGCAIDVRDVIGMRYYHIGTILSAYVWCRDKEIS